MRCCLNEKSLSRRDWPTLKVCWSVCILMSATQYVSFKYAATISDSYAVRGIIVGSADTMGEATLESVLAITALENRFWLGTSSN